MKLTYVDIQNNKSQYWDIQNVLKDKLNADISSYVIVDIYFDIRLSTKNLVYTDVHVIIYDVIEEILNDTITSRFN